MATTLDSYRVDFCLSLVVYGGVQPATHYCLEKLMQYAIKTGEFKYYESMSTQDALVSRARSIEAHRFIEANLAPYLIFVDADIVFEPEHIKKLLENLKKGYDLIGGCYTFKDGGDLAQCGIGSKILMDGSIHEVEYISTGFWGMSRKLCDTIRIGLDLHMCDKGEKWENVPYFECGAYEHPTMGWMFISEDWDFVNKARKVGVKPYLDTSIRVGHMTVSEKTVNDMLERQQKDVGEALPLQSVQTHERQEK